jgi:hypothetical protein
MDSAIRFKYGIRLIGDDVDRFINDGSIELSAGIIPAKSQHASLGYWENAFVPKLPWRAPTTAELDLLLGPAKAMQHGQWVQILKVPEKVFNLFEGARIASQYPTDQKLREYTASIECHDAIRRTAEYASTLAWPEHRKIDRASVFFKATGLPTTTPRKYPELLGLHIDTAYKQVPFNERKYAPGRISINLGLCDRFLLFINICTEQMHQMLAEQNIAYHDDIPSSTHEFRKAFMSVFSDYSVVKVRVRPGEGYIAPTENMIHDGSTVGQTCFDVQFSACGHFRPLSSSIDDTQAALLSSWLRKDEIASPLQFQRPQ